MVTLQLSQKRGYANKPDVSICNYKSNRRNVLRGFSRPLWPSNSQLKIFQRFWPTSGPKFSICSCNTKFITAILNDESPVIYGDGEQSRDFTFVKNVVDANILSCESKKTGIFNIACGRRITINQLADYINEILGKGNKINTCRTKTWRY